MATEWTKQQQDGPVRTLLIGIDTGEYDAEQSIGELTELARTAGAQVEGTLIQRRDAPDPATCLGAGRLAEAELLCRNLDIELVIFDRELTGSQTANLEQALDVRVIDRTTLILDIFAQRARSAEGRLQVELAQQKYRLPRLTGKGIALSRLGGGIGTRGPGETQLETDRRHIRRRIAALERQLEDLTRRRSLARQRRRKDEVTCVAIVGYTNVGKSTLLNALTDAGVLAEDLLFATLDPTARALSLPDGRRVMLIDTVGLIRRLPHLLVEAFRSTLEEAAEADLILNVCDISAPDAAEQIAVSTALLREIGAQKVPVLNVLNKCDRLCALPEVYGRDNCLISARTGWGLDRLLERIEALLPPTHTRIRLLIPYSEGGLLGEIRSRGTVCSQQFLEQGALIDVWLDLRLLPRCRPFFAPSDERQ